MDVSDYIGSVKAEGESFASAAEQGELNVSIAACPGWDMREMVRHLGLRQNTVFKFWYQSWLLLRRDKAITDLTKR